MRLIHKHNCIMKILSIDGGGIRGIIPGVVLVALEQKLQEMSGNPAMRLADVFDMMAGTSTGGILACLYLCPDKASGRPKFSAQEAVDLYFEHGRSIFEASSAKRLQSLDGLRDEKYSAHALEKTLSTYFGDLTLGDMLKPCMITAYDIERRQAHFFTSKDVASKGAGWDFYLRDVARATSAAPTYFEPARITSLDQSIYPLVDGAMFANNPTMCACIEAFTSKAGVTVKDLQVLSLGTGDTDQAYDYKEAKDWGKVGWIVPALDIMMSGVAETVDFQLQQLFSSVGCSSQYMRLQAALKDFAMVDRDLDNASKTNMQELKHVGESLAASADGQLTDFAAMLLGK